MCPATLMTIVLDWLTNSITMPVIADKSKDGSWKNINTDVFGKVIIEHSWK